MAENIDKLNKLIENSEESKMTPEEIEDAKEADETKGMTRAELKEYHEAKGGLVLDDDEFGKYKDYLQILAAE